MNSVFFVPFSVAPVGPVAPSRFASWEIFRTFEKTIPMKRLTLFLLYLLFPLSLVAQEGTWSGKLDVGGQKLRLVFHLSQQTDGWHATMDSPDQGVKGIPVDSVALSPLGLTVSIKTLAMTYTGGFMGKDNLVGALNQHGQSLSLMLTRGEPERPNRPQEPTKPYPYREEEVLFVSRDGGLELHGTLTLPAGEGRHPALVLVTGSGTQNRDEELMDHRPFLVLADRLSRAGYAVLRYDDRGFGASKEEQQRLAYSTTDHLMLDALGAFDYLLRHPAIDPARVGIGGHSEGGTIAVMAAAEESRVAFVVSLAGMMTTGAALLATQNRVLMQEQGVPEAMAAGYARALERLYAKWQQQSPEELMRNADRLVAECVSGEPLPAPLVENLKLVAHGAQNPWLYRFVQLDPLAEVAKVAGRPMWAANGTKDLQVDAEQNLGRLEALKRDEITTLRFEGMNHLFQPCTTGLTTEYGQIETTLAEEVMTALVAWLNQAINPQK